MDHFNKNPRQAQQQDIDETRRISSKNSFNNFKLEKPKRPPRNRRSDRHKIKNDDIINKNIHLKGSAQHRFEQSLNNISDDISRHKEYKNKHSIPLREKDKRNISNTDVQRVMVGQARPGIVGDNYQTNKATNRKSNNDRSSKRKAEPKYLSHNKKTKKNSTLSVVVGFLLILGFMLVVMAILPDGDIGIVGKLNNTKTFVTKNVSKISDRIADFFEDRQNKSLEILSFTGTPSLANAPTEVGFTIETSTNVQKVRLEDSKGNILEGETKTINNEESTIWTILVYFEEPFLDIVKIHLSEDLENWQESDKSLQISINEEKTIDPPTPTAQTQQYWDESGPLKSAVISSMEEENLEDKYDKLTEIDTTNSFENELKNIDDNFELSNKGSFLEDKVETDALRDLETENLDYEHLADNARNIISFENDDENILSLVEEENKSSLGDASETIGKKIDDSDVREESGLQPTSAPEPTPKQSISTPQPTPKPTPTPMPILLAEAMEGTNPEQIGMSTQVYLNDRTANNYSRIKEFKMPEPNNFKQYDNGIFTFRNGPFRQNASFGFAKIVEENMKVAWKLEVGKIDNYSGIYWTGQAAIVQWPKEIRAMMPIVEEKIEKAGLKEVIIASQDGKIYFMDYEDGIQTRQPIDIGYPLRSSINIHPSSIPILTVGQGISKLKKGTGKIGYYIFDLTNHKQLMFVNGRDKTAHGTNGAMDGTAIIDPTSDTMIFGAENGLIYTIALNKEFLLEDESITINPEVVKYKYKAKNQNPKDTAIEGSLAIYNNYAYFADAHGILQCLDINTMKPIWAIETDDNTDASVVLDFDGDKLYLYTVNTFLRQGKNGVVTMRKLDALTGMQVWSKSVEVKKDTEEIGGGMASPIVGEHSIDNMIVFTIAKTSGTQGTGGEVFALDKKTGAEIWTTKMKHFSWSSPTAVYNEEGKAWILQADNSGMLNMIDSETGEILNTLDLEGKIYASPAVYENILVIGTSEYIYGIELK